MVGLMFSHHLIATNAVRDRMHNGPLRCGGIQSTFGLFLWQVHHSTSANIHVECFILNVDAAPYDFAWLRYTVHRAATIGEIHGGLTVSVSTFPAIDEMLRWCSTTDQEDPYVIVAVLVAPSKIMQCVFYGLLQQLVNAIG
jgi:hypothetical protein